MELLCLMTHVEILNNFIFYCQFCSSEATRGGSYLKNYKKNKPLEISGKPKTKQHHQHDIIAWSMCIIAMGGWGRECSTNVLRQ